MARSARKEQIVDRLVVRRVDRDADGVDEAEGVRVQIGIVQYSGAHGGKRARGDRAVTAVRRHSGDARVGRP